MDLLERAKQQEARLFEVVPAFIERFNSGGASTADALRPLALDGYD
ncbi:MAG: hypothetical protein AB1938_23245 [Myxococcota bacterium]